MSCSCAAPSLAAGSAPVQAYADATGALRAQLPDLAGNSKPAAVLVGSGLSVVRVVPTVGSVAWWPHKRYGHVAVILKVSKDKKHIVVGEGNWTHRFGYDERTLKKGTSAWPADILHINK